MAKSLLQYRHFIPAPVDWTSASTWLYEHPWIQCHQYKYQYIKGHVAVRSCQEILLEIGREVVYYGRIAHAFSAGIKCRHCMWLSV